MGHSIQVLETRNKGSFKVYIPGSAAEQVRIRVTDIAGRQVKELTTDSGNHIEFTLADEGLYILNISTASENFTTRIKVEK